MDRWEVEKAKELAKIKKRAKDVVPSIYACMAKALYDSYGWDGDQIEELFIKTQDLWNANADSMDSMIKWVSDTTGIEVQGDGYV